MKVWWQEQALSEEQAYLQATLFEAHHRSAFRDNPSSIVVANTAAASGDMAKSIATGLLAIGGKHAPIKQTHELLSWEMPWDEARHLLKWKQKVPGWGGTWQKDKPDPAWQPVEIAIYKFYPEMANKLEKVTQELHECGKLIFPNPSAYTAAVAIILGLNSKEAVYLFIRARLDAWAQIAAAYIKGDPTVWASPQP